MERPRLTRPTRPTERLEDDHFQPLLMHCERKHTAAKYIRGYE